MAFSTSSIWVKISFIVLAIAGILQIVGVATPSWISIEISLSPTATLTATTGLWKQCGKTQEESKCKTIEPTFFGSESLPGWFEAVRAFGIIGILVVIAAAILTALCVFVFEKSSNKLVYTISMILAFAAGACILLSIIIFGAKSDLQDPATFGFSFGLSIAGALLSLIAGALLAVDAFQNNIST